jgi:acyl-CoA reductase-like NAD-dependent aldehyde dehydrogenase
VRPTVFTDVPLDAPLSREEVFGPVLAVYRAETWRRWTSRWTQFS